MMWELMKTKQGLLVTLGQGNLLTSTSLCRVDSGGVFLLTTRPVDKEQPCPLLIVSGSFLLPGLMAGITQRLKSLGQNTQKAVPLME